MHRIRRRVKLARRRQHMREVLGKDRSEGADSSEKSNESSITIDVTNVHAVFYVLSGCTQPLLMTLCKDAGLADPNCQLYMLFYYLGPAFVVFSLLSRDVDWPARATCLKACGIALWDIISTSMNYTGASLAGPTIFAIVYSSVTIWTALFSQLLLGRLMNVWQWFGVVTVFLGLTLTASDTLKLGSDVITGLILVIAGSAMHALTYVGSEAVMTMGVNDLLSVSQNCAIQGLVACVCFLLWQLIYTAPHFEELIWGPMQAAGTTVSYGLIILFSFFFANLVHSITFFHTLRHFPGGATSAGVMKGLQAALVFVFTHFAYCGRTGGEEMCFSRAKFFSLVTVVGGVVLFGYATGREERSGSRRFGYTTIEDQSEVEIEPLS